MRISLECLCLQILDIGSNNIKAFLEHGLCIPPEDTIITAINLLQDLGAIKKIESIIYYILYTLLNRKK